MNYTLEDLQQLQETKNSRDEQYMQDREHYLAGKRGFPNQPDDALPERQRGCQWMGYQSASLES